MSEQLKTELLVTFGHRLRHARREKSLSQRALGERVGLPQSHISKIEQGAVDLQFSSLAELARALDLELTLVPRAAVAALEGTIQAATGRNADPSASRARTILDEQAQLLADLESAFPATDKLSRYGQAIDELRQLHFDTPALKALQEAVEPSRKLARLLHSNDSRADIMKALDQATASLRALRNHRVHAPVLPSPRQRPAHRLEEDDD
ncbi:MULTISPECIES: helix-turn-helix domain-containing protein [Stakelama]|uniref:Helix-turn-helix protein n=2 Tax=Stakelama TaxID=1124625 RepID=A0A4R6FU07_9SPHN|nr:MULTISPECIES: helix-turn-helix transcriptional regulator [Stakelama]MAW99921.1 transcriptional regulator [Sphingomonas sp.]TDN85301.1 helix-turn-helix protein [Stakelama pacifica]WNO53480.1 helix-turn-helix transcriptional regulator [Stakelama sp. W311]